MIGKVNNMGRLTVLLNQESKEKLSIPAYLTDDNVTDLDKFLKENESSLYTNYIDTLSSYLTQVNGYFNQLMVRGEGLISKDKQNQYTDKAKALEDKENNKTKENLEEIIKDYFSLYDEASSNISMAISENDKKKEKAQLISSINDLLAKIDQAYVETDTSIDNSLSSIVKLYQKALIETDNEQMATLTLLLDEEKRILANDKENKAVEVATAKKKEFDLFDKINDLIIDKEFKKKDNLIFARYILEDGSNYYAIVPDGNRVLAEDKEFKTFSSFEMNRKKVEENLKLVVSNLMIYYDLNEYTRYVEMIYKKQMTKDVDQAIGQYKARLTTMEQIIKSQLTLIDDIAPILNRKTSEKYPNIVYNDTLVKDFYPDELNNTLTDEKIKEQRKLMIKLADDSITNNITTREVLGTLYEHSLIEELTSSFSTPDKDMSLVEKPVINNDTDSTAINVTPLVTNYQKISDYIKLRKEQLDKVASGDSDALITKDNESIYQNVNTIFDLNTAAAISDNQYSVGQGIYAITQYLKTGEANRFTSSANARTLASTVKPNNYLSIVMENMVKSFAGSGKKANEDPTYLDRMQQVLSFVKDELSKDNFSANDMKSKLLASDNLLAIAIKNFDYTYLDPISENSKLFDQAIEIGLNNNNSSAIRIKQALTDIKTVANSEFAPVQSVRQTLAA